MNNPMQQMQRQQIQEENRFGELRSKIDQIGFQMESCCCKIMTQMLQDKYDASLRDNAKLLAEKTASEQSAYLLSVMGKWVANAPAAAA